MHDHVYFAGAAFPDVSTDVRGGQPIRRFSTVTPARRTPYVFFDEAKARYAYSLMRHHCGLYVTKDFKTATLVLSGGLLCSDLVPPKVNLPLDVSEGLRKAVAQYPSRL